MSIATNRTRNLLAALFAAALLTLAFAQVASASVSWRVASQHGPTNFAPGDGDPSTPEGQYIIQAHNTGTTDNDDIFVVTDQLPPGVTATGGSGLAWDCSLTDFSTHPSTVTCMGFFAFAATVGVPPAEIRDAAPTLFIDVSVDPGASGAGSNEVTIAGGETASCPDFPPTPTGSCPSATDVDPTSFSSTPAGFGLSDFLADFFDGSGPGAAPVRQAGSRPAEMRVNFDTNLKRVTDPTFGVYTTPDEHPKTIVTKLPTGFLGNPEAIAKCTAQQLSNGSCPIASQVGTLDLLLNSGGVINEIANFNWPLASQDLPVYNMVPEKGVLADLGFTFQQFPVHIAVSLDPDDHYRVISTVKAAVELYPVRSAELSLWGVPFDPSHDHLRYDPVGIFGTPAGLPPAPFLTMPSDCSVPGRIEMRMDSWQHPGAFKDYASEAMQMSGCAKQVFEPAIESKPTTNLADAPSGLDFKLHVPQNEDPEGLATPPLRDAVVTLPKGMTVNPPSADGLQACSMAQLGISASEVPNDEPVSCPEASKLGSVTVNTPALADPLGGSVYLAKQDENPFGSLLAIYLVLEEPERDVLIKLAGEVKADPQDGQLTTVFKQNPQFPVEDLELHLKEGPRAALKTPSRCGTHTTTSTLTPWTSPEGADATPASGFELTGGPDGGPCPSTGAAAPNQPSFSAGTLDPSAGTYSPFVLKLARADASQPLRAIETTLPPGLAAKFAGVPYCPEAALAAAAGNSGRSEQAAPSCPASSRVGSVDVGAGTGSTPLHVNGDAYLAGPYKGAPMSLAILTPAVAGPFDLGVVVVRTALHVNPVTAQGHAVSDPVPQILDGIPLNVRSISVRLDRPTFTLNPTSCDEMAVLANATSVFDQSASLSQRFQVGDCQRLGFKPKLAMRLIGPTHRSAHPKLRATLTMPKGGANIARAAVTLPKTEFLENAHIKTICTRVQYAAKSCPAKSVYGYAKAWTPLLDQPLQGPVYLRSSNNPLPDLVASLDGQIHVDLAGRIDSVNSRIRNTFDLVPDAPVSKFVLTMQGGGKGLLVNNTELCKAKPRLDARFDAQNGKVRDIRPLVKADCGGKRKGKKR